MLEVVFVRKRSLYQAMMLLRRAASLILVFALIFTDVTRGEGAEAKDLDTKRCHDLAEDGDCRFFLECLEKRIPCGPGGYAINHGYDICNKYHMRLKDFNKKGRQFVDDINSHLMLEILASDAYQEKGTCEDIDKFVDEVLPDVIVESSFCRKILLSPQNLKAMAGVYSITDILEELTLFKDAVVKCPSRWLNKISDWFNKFSQSV